ncbi:MAG: hypothetical protein V4674_04550 [Patescibacteria group bacterium]
MDTREKGGSTVEVSLPKKELPILVKIAGVLFALSGLFHILIGFPLIIFLGLGLLFIAIGAAELFLGTWIYLGKKSAYFPALVVGIVSVLSSFSFHRLSSLLPLFFLAVIYFNRDEFVN